MIIRTKKFNNFFQMQKAPLENTKLSRKAKGILAYLISRPPNRKTRDSHLEKQSTDGRESLKNGLSELSKLGYRIKVKVVDKGKKIIRRETFVFETPILIKNHITGNPLSGKPAVLTLEESELDASISALGIKFARIEVAESGKGKVLVNQITGFPASGKPVTNNIESNNIDSKDISNMAKKDFSEKKEKEFKKSAEQTASQLGEEFSKFWNHYPKKEKRMEAQLEFMKAVARGEKTNEIISGIIHYVAYRRKEGTENKYIPLAKNRIEGVRWKDGVGGTKNKVSNGVGKKSIDQQEAEEIAKYV